VYIQLLICELQVHGAAAECTIKFLSLKPKWMEPAALIQSCKKLKHSDLLQNGTPVQNDAL